MSLDGLEKLAPMGYVPKPPPMVDVHHRAPPISVAEDSTFDLWMDLPPGDGRTLEEFASNPVKQLVTREIVRPKCPPPPPPSRPPGTPIVLESGVMYSSFREHGPPDSGGTFKR